MIPVLKIPANGPCCSETEFNASETSTGHMAGHKLVCHFYWDFGKWVIAAIDHASCIGSINTIVPKPANDHADPRHMWG
jgi:hypothetical protein